MNMMGYESGEWGMVYAKVKGYCKGVEGLEQVDFKLIKREIILGGPDLLQESFKV